MNINDFTVEGPDDAVNITEAIFERQKELMEKYHHIEVKNNLCPEDLKPPYELDDRFAQFRIKDFLWRTTEELMEAYEAYGYKDFLHEKEELIDALHFITELCICVGLSPEKMTLIMKGEGNLPENLGDISVDNDPIRLSNFGLFLKEQSKMKAETSTVGYYMQVIFLMGMVGNTLKNKPWKQSHVLTDEVKFFDTLTLAYLSLVDLMWVRGIDEREVYSFYFRKAEVNTFRQNSNY